MNPVKAAVLATRNVARNRRRSAITVLVTAIGAAAIMVAGGFGLYSYESLRERAAREVGHVIVTHPDYFEGPEDRPMAHGLAKPGTVAVKMEQDPRVRMVIPRLELSGLITNGDKSTIFVGTGIDPKLEFRVTGPFLAVREGELLSHAEPTVDPPVMLAEGLAQTMNATVGAHLTLLTTTTEGALNALDVEVVAVFSTGKPELDARKILMPLQVAQGLLDTQKVSTLAAYLHQTEDTDSVRSSFQDAIPDVALKTWGDLAFYYFKVRALYDRIFGTMGGIIVLMVFFAVANTLSMAVVERTREIGMLRALGTTPWQILQNFALEAVVLALMGSALGLLLAASVSFGLPWLELEMPPPPGMTVGYPLYVYFSTELGLICGLGLITLSVVAAVVTSRRAAGAPIVEALTHV